MITTFKIAGDFDVTISAIDADLLSVGWSPHKPARSRTIYVQRSVNAHDTESLHRVILGRILGRELLSTEQVDHKDNNGLNNTRNNLRLATQSQNKHNSPKCSTRKSSQYKGVSWCKRSGKWQAYITKNGKQRGLGYFDNELAAAKRYDVNARLLYGEFAFTNFGRGISK